MVILHGIPRRPLNLRAPVAAIGIFDGVHLGHQVILRKAVARAKAYQGAPVAVTFDPHPCTVLHPQVVPPLILSLEQRLRWFAQCGIQAAVVIPFTRSFSRWSPERFVKGFLVDRLQVQEVVVGHDFCFGLNRSGTVETLRQLAARYRFNVRVVQPVIRNGERVSSRRIRELIRQGDLVRVQRMLGRPAGVVGKVIHGAGRGGKLGFPTANLKLEAGVLPPVGVYAVRAAVGGRSHAGMANVGFRPTFRGQTPQEHLSTREPLLEVHLFGQRRSLHGKRLEVEFYKRLRTERRFRSPQALVRQLARDATRAKRFLR